MKSKTITKSFPVDLEAIIDLCAGFGAYFEQHPEEEASFPRCNDRDEERRKGVKSHDMFIGKKTETFDKLLQILSIELDTCFLEAEYYLTAPGEGEIYEYRNGATAIAFNFYIEPTAQIETCDMALTFPKDREEEITGLIWQLLNDSVYAVKLVCDGGFDKLEAEFQKLTNSKKNPVQKITSFFKKKLIIKGGVVSIE